MKGFLFKTGFRAAFPGFPRKQQLDRGGDHRICKFGSKSMGFDKLFIKVLAESPNLKIQAQDSNVRIPNPGIQAQGSKPRTPNPENQTQEWTLCHKVGLVFLESKPWNPNQRIQTLKSKPEDPNQGIRIQKCKPRNPNAGIQTQESKHRNVNQGIQTQESKPRNPNQAIHSKECKANPGIQNKESIS